MNPPLLILNTVDRIRGWVQITGLIVSILLGLTACADTHWERAVYQGVRHGSDQCKISRKPADAPCAELLDYDRYEQERAKAIHETTLTNLPH